MSFSDGNLNRRLSLEKYLMLIYKKKTAVFWLLRQFPRFIQKMNRVVKNDSIQRSFSSLGESKWMLKTYIYKIIRMG